MKMNALRVTNAESQIQFSEESGARLDWIDLIVCLVHLVDTYLDHGVDVHCVCERGDWVFRG
jgi:hypothetical protein|tara:strand:- start:10470 stop:10655 length:186 start_codon:yes stop_codon:yes gene_type:complete